MYQIKIIQGGDDNFDPKLKVPSVIDLSKASSAKATEFLSKKFDGMYKKTSDSSSKELKMNLDDSLGNSSRAKVASSGSSFKAAPIASKTGRSQQKDSNISHVSADGRVWYKGVGHDSSKDKYYKLTPEDMSKVQKYVEWSKKRTAELISQGLSPEEASQQVIKERFDDLEKKLEAKIAKVQKEKKCSRKEAKRAIYIKSGMKHGKTKAEAEADADKALKYEEAYDNAKSYAQNPGKSPETKFGFNYRKLMEYLAISRQWGFVYGPNGEKFTTEELEAEAKRIEQQYNIDRNTFDNYADYWWKNKKK